MKKAKKLFSALLAATMLLSGFATSAMPAFAKEVSVNSVNAFVSENGAISIKDAYAAAAGTAVTVIGQVVYTYAAGATGDPVNVIIEDVIDDETVGLLIYNKTDNLSFEVGQVVEVSGTMSSYKNLIELANLTGVTVVNDAAESVIPPQEVTLADLTANPADYVNEYVTVNDVVLGTYNETGSTSVSDGTNSIDIFKGAAFPEGIEAGDKVDLTCVVSLFNETYQLRVGSSDDYVLVEKAVSSDTDTDTASDTETDTDTASDTETDTNTASDTETDTEADTSVMLVGDVDGNGAVNMVDVTELQKVVASIYELDEDAALRANVDGVDPISMIDVVYIQQFIAEIIKEFPIGNTIGGKVSTDTEEPTDTDEPLDTDSDEYRAELLEKLAEKLYEIEYNWDDYYNNDDAYWTAESYEVFDSAYKAAQQIAEDSDSYTVDEISDALDALVAAAEGLAADLSNYTKEEIVELLQEYYDSYGAETEETGPWTAETYAPYLEVCQKVEEALTSPDDYTKQELWDLCDELEEAWDLLAYDYDAMTKERLLEVIAADMETANIIIQYESLFTPESFADFKAAYDALSAAVEDSENQTKENLLELYYALVDAAELLEGAKEDTSDVDTDSERVAIIEDMDSWVLYFEYYWEDFYNNDDEYWPEEYYSVFEEAYNNAVEILKNTDNYTTEELSAALDDLYRGDALLTIYEYGSETNDPYPYTADSYSAYEAVVTKVNDALADLDSYTGEALWDLSDELYSAWEGLEYDFDAMTKEQAIAFSTDFAESYSDFLDYESDFTAESFAACKTAYEALTAAIEDPDSYEKDQIVELLFAFFDAYNALEETTDTASLKVPAVVCEAKKK